MKALIALLLLLPHEPIPTVYCDFVEDNRVYRGEFDPASGEMVWEERLHQLIFWGAFPGERIAHVREWCWATPNSYSIDFETGTVYFEHRIVRAAIVVETETDYDPEVADQDNLVPHHRWRLR